jgi:hypothetical protein
VPNERTASTDSPNIHHPRDLATGLAFDASVEHRRTLLRRKLGDGAFQIAQVRASRAVRSLLAPTEAQAHQHRLATVVWFQDEGEVYSFNLQAVETRYQHFFKVLTEFNPKTLICHTR